MRMLYFVRYSGSFCIRGMRSLLMMLAGTVQNGWKLISWILELTIGDGRSTLPTTAVWRDTTTPFSTASTDAAGMLTMTKRADGSFEVNIFSRVRLVTSWVRRTVAGMLSAMYVDSPTIPSAWMPWRAWKRLT